MSIVKLNNRGVKDATAFGSITGLGNLKFISRSTASSSASVNITSGLTSTYKEYIFIFNNIHPATDGAKFQFNLSVDSGSNYNVTKTTSFFHAFHTEDGSSTVLAYRGAADLAQSTSDQVLFWEVDNDADSGASGYLHLFDPSSTTFVKHFIAKSSGVGNSTTAGNQYVGGYGNTTSAVDAIQFKMSSGNIDSGTIDMYGVL
tara:strand:+ start:73 stop:678 length:606 start_codon:yes stop_codon:yes gene_type:complete